jgi:hypothetical protein
MSRLTGIFRRKTDSTGYGNLTSLRSQAVFLPALALALLIVGCQLKARESKKPVAEMKYTVWPSEPPADCPFQKSKVIAGIAFTPRHAEYGHADSWYPSWASNGDLYSPFTDGSVDDVKSMSNGPKATTGLAEIIGNDPMRLKVRSIGTVAASPEPYGIRYPCATLVYNRIWYYVLTYKSRILGIWDSAQGSPCWSWASEIDGLGQAAPTVRRMKL